MMKIMLVATSYEIEDMLLAYGWYVSNVYSKSYNKAYLQTAVGRCEVETITRPRSMLYNVKLQYSFTTPLRHTIGLQVRSYNSEYLQGWAIDEQDVIM
jgi:hypothetical protein